MQQHANHASKHASKHANHAKIMLYMLIMLATC